MPDLSKIEYNGTEYTIKDSTARSTLTTLSSSVSSLQSANETVLSALQEIKTLLTAQGNTSAVAILDQAILDLSELA